MCRIWPFTSRQLQVPPRQKRLQGRLAAGPGAGREHVQQGGLVNDIIKGHMTLIIASSLTFRLDMSQYEISSGSDEELPFACYICRETFRTPVITR